MFLLFFDNYRRNFMSIKAKFCSMSTKFGTMYLSLFHSPSVLFDDLCDIFIVPEDSALPTLRFVWSSRNKVMFGLTLKSSSYNGFELLSPIMDTSDSFILELDFVDFTDISEIQKIVEETVKWTEYWYDVTFSSENHIPFVADLPDSRYYANFR